ncbi:MAG: transcriptional regulator [Christensenellaceae bacterium]|nr:transcriptional regulator [Christensenellaceae bacterium]
MDINNIPEDIRLYIPFIDMLGETLGPDVEIVLHDLSHPQSSVVYAVNTEVTGRKVGQSFNYLIDRVLLSPRFNGTYLSNYKFISKDGKTIRSSSIFLRNKENQAIGAICININVNHIEKASNFFNKFLIFPDDKYHGNTSQDVFHVEDIVNEIIDNIITKYLVSIEPDRNEKLAVIRKMDEQGVFLAKSAIDRVAERMNISKVTIYSYLDEIRKDE